jgi:hypothetical protein
MEIQLVYQNTLFKLNHHRQLIKEFIAHKIEEVYSS